MRKLFISLVGSCICSSALAAGGWHAGTIERLLLDNRDAGDPTYPTALRYGGCAARVTPHPNTTVATCGAYVSMGCDGVILSKSVANNNFGSAQLAYVASKRITFFIDDAYTSNGACIARSVIVEDP